MALRPLRNATISFGLVSIPVRFYTATKSEDVHFNLLHESCGTRVNRKWWCPHHEKIESFVVPQLALERLGEMKPAPTTEE